MKVINHKIEAKADITKLTPHPQNPRNGDTEAIGRSIDHTGFYGVVVAQLSTGRILAGNHRYHVAMEQEAKTLPVAWVDVDDRQALDILLSDNRTSDLARQDDSILAGILQELSDDGGLEGTGYNDEDLSTLLLELQTAENAPLNGEPNEGYTQTIESPIYEPEGEQPLVSALYRRDVADKLEDAIQGEDLPDEIREFLLLAAARHVRFDFQSIANYYAHAPEPVQKLMEQSALVIIDYDQAIENGFVRLNDDVAAAFAGDHPDA